MNSDRGVGEPPVKKERLYKDLEMVNYEMPMQIDLPNAAAAAEIDPLMPVETKQEPAEITQPSSSLDFARRIKREPEINKEISEGIDDAASCLKKIDSVISGLVLPSGQIRETYDTLESMGRSDNTIQPKQETTGQASDSAGNIIQLADDDKPPGIQQRNRFHQAFRKHSSSILRSVLMETSDFCVRDPSVDGSQKLVTNVMEPLPASQGPQHFSNAQQGQEPVSTPALSIFASGNRQANTKTRDFNSVGGSELKSEQVPTGIWQDLQLIGSNQSEISSHQSAAAAATVAAAAPAAAAPSAPAAAIAITYAPSIHQGLGNNSLPILPPVSAVELLRHPFSGGSWPVEQKNGIIPLSKPKTIMDTHVKTNVPDAAAAAEINPLMPVETTKEPAEIIEPSRLLDFARPIKSEPEMEKEISYGIDDAESCLPKSDSEVSGLALPSNQICESYGNLESTGQPDNTDLKIVVKQGTDTAAAIAGTYDTHHSPGNNSLPILEPVPVVELLKTPFSGGSWTEEQKNGIIALSRPKPIMTMLNHTPAQLFYDKIPWLCGCAFLKKFFCWPCLLFSYNLTNTDLWSVQAIQMMEMWSFKRNEFEETCEAHKSSPAHREAETKLLLQNAQSTPIALLARKQHIERGEERLNPTDVEDFLISAKVRRNRKLLSVLVQSVCYLRKEKHDARTVDYAECFAYIVQSDKRLQETLTEFQGSSSMESSADFVFNYAHVVEDSVKKFVKSTISEELQNPRFVTLFMEDLSSIVEESTVAFVAHFVDQAGKVQQRIIESHKIGYDRSAGTVFELFRGTVFQHGLQLKVAGFTYSATLVHPSEIKAFNVRVKRMCPSAKFFHYQGHDLLGMLSGALSHLNRCSNFFRTITDLQIFFKKYHIFPSHFEQFPFAQWQSQSPQAIFLTTLKRTIFIYSKVLQTLASCSRFPKELGISSQGLPTFFISFLQHTSTRFLIFLFTQINLAIGDITGALQGKTEPAEWRWKIRRAIENLINIKNFGFTDIYLTAVIAMSSNLVKETHAQRSDVPDDLISIFNEILDTAIIFLRQRFYSGEFGYVDLTSVITGYFARIHLKPHEIERCISKIQLLFKEPQIKDKSLPEALKTLRDCHHLASDFPVYTTFLNFAMTVSSSNTSLYCPLVEWIQGYQRKKACKPSSRDLIWVEKDLLGDIARRSDLSEAVIRILTITNEGTKEFSYDNFRDLVLGT